MSSIELETDLLDQMDKKKTTEEKTICYLNEEIEPSDYAEIRKLIRMEIANVLFDLFKKRGVWI